MGLEKLRIIVENPKIISKIFNKYCRNCVIWLDRRENECENCLLIIQTITTPSLFELRIKEEEMESEEEEMESEEKDGK